MCKNLMSCFFDSQCSWRVCCFQPVVAAVGDPFYKITSEALLVCQQLAIVIRPLGLYLYDVSHQLCNYHQLCTKHKLQLFSSVKGVISSFSA